ncbi:MAG TPA: response regulator transcription factor [Acidimicrobiales bacterium]|nr:response regulator transcription factor [Acidimicrobiales bacterium]
MAESEDTTVGVLIVDDHRMFSESLARLLADEDGITVLGVADAGADAIEMVTRLQPKVVLMDYQLPDQDGVSVTAQIRRQSPEVMVVMLTGSTEDRVLLAAIDAGCSGFLTKDRAAAEVVHAVRAAAVGEALISPALLARLLPKLNRTQRTLGEDLSEREREILGFLARGLTNKVIAAELFLSVNTIRNHVQSVLAKLGAHSKLEAVSTAVREGIIDYPTASNG